MRMPRPGNPARSPRMSTYPTHTTCPCPCGHHADPRHVFLTAAQVIARYGWGRTKGYLKLKEPGFPRPVGGVWRLDTLMAYEERVAAGELPGEVPTAAPAAETTAPAPAQFPARRRTRTDRKAA